MEKKLLGKFSLFFADLAHTRPFSGLWCKKQNFILIFLKKMKKLKVGF